MLLDALVNAEDFLVEKRKRMAFLIHREEVSYMINMVFRTLPYMPAEEILSKEFTSFLKKEKTC